MPQSEGTTGVTTTRAASLDGRQFRFEGSLDAPVEPGDFVTLHGTDGRLTSRRSTTSTSPWAEH